MVRQKGAAGAAYLLRRCRELRQQIEKESSPITAFLLKGENKVTLSEEESKKGTVKVFVNKHDFEKIDLTKSVYENLCGSFDKVLKEGDKISNKTFEEISNIVVLCSASGVSVEAKEAIEQLKQDGWMKTYKDYTDKFLGKSVEFSREEFESLTRTSEKILAAVKKLKNGAGVNKLKNGAGSDAGSNTEDGPE
ncbi:hypothetical protein LguiA_027829 [Lonicera macranthoides]